MIKKLEAIRAKEGDIRVTIYDEDTAYKRWGYKNEELWVNVKPTVDMITDDDDDKEIEKVVCMYPSFDEEDE